MVSRAVINKAADAGTHSYQTMFARTFTTLAASAGLPTGPQSGSGAVRPHSSIDVKGNEVYVKSPATGLPPAQIGLAVFVPYRLKYKAGQIKSKWQRLIRDSGQRRPPQVPRLRRPAAPRPAAGRARSRTRSWPAIQRWVWPEALPTEPRPRGAPHAWKVLG